MLLFRSLAIGMLGAILFLVAEPRPLHQVAATTQVPSDPAPTIIDVAPGVPVSTIPSLVRLDAGEYVVAIDDQPVHDDFEAGALLEAHAAKRYFDLSVSSPRHQRRILVLMH